MKKTLSVTLALLSAALLLGGAGCSSQTSTSADTVPQQGARIDTSAQVDGAPAPVIPKGAY